MNALRAPRALRAIGVLLLALAVAAPLAAQVPGQNSITVNGEVLVSGDPPMIHDPTINVDVGGNVNLQNSYGVAADFIIKQPGNPNPSASLGLVGGAFANITLGCTPADDAYLPPGTYDICIRRLATGQVARVGTLVVNPKPGG